MHARKSKNVAKSLTNFSKTRRRFFPPQSCQFPPPTPSPYLDSSAACPFTKGFRHFRNDCVCQKRSDQFSKTRRKLSFQSCQFPPPTPSLYLESDGLLSAFAFSGQVHSIYSPKLFRSGQKRMKTILPWNSQCLPHIPSLHLESSVAWCRQMHYLYFQKIFLRNSLPKAHKN